MPTKGSTDGGPLVVFLSLSACYPRAGTLSSPLFSTLEFLIDRVSALLKDKHTPSNELSLTCTDMESVSI
ncbi:hypothetical protein BD324DRAFT_625716 [Kockovaella imperatae]|uniref:Uncharacterized protein n=1 Tax=Kockovaella imperatae TaxID=4999 RepID=A0A1Y1UH02_9TREE|nr:hypothetical protein BD324DRAFT_625716 [Kockovaella imperatae]ORX37333.1 hypothetical protein BD324DRAFT_625716 [Kockovaella imperatae]